MSKRIGVALLLVALALGAAMALPTGPVTSQVGRLELSPGGGAATAGEAFTMAVTALAADNVDTAYNGTVHFSSSDSGATLPDAYTFVPDTDNGSHTFTGAFSLRTSGTQTITVTDNGSLTDTVTWSVSAAAIDHYTVTSDRYSQQTTVSFIVAVTARDRNGNLVPADNVSITMTCSASVMAFDGNANGTYGESGDDTGALAAGALEMSAKPTTTSDGLTITATDAQGRTGVSQTYSVKDFRCFIATAAWGTPLAREIEVLRDFRDQYLMLTPAGRAFVSAYYHCSPRLARFIDSHDWLRTVVRAGLTPVVWLTEIFVTTTPVEKLLLSLLMLAPIDLLLSWRALRRLRPP